MKPLIIVVLALALATPAARASDANLLPADGFHDGWKREGAVRVFPGPELYGHIDGGAELFLESGFVECTLAHYRSGGDDLIVEIYRMSDPEAALAVYLAKCGREERDPSFAPRHTINPFQLTFVKGDRFVLLTHEQGKAARRKDLLAFGSFVAERCPKDRPVAALERLPKPGLVADTVRLGRGPVALQSFPVVGDDDVLRLDRKLLAVAADYAPEGQEPYSLVVVDYPDEAAAAAALESVVRAGGSKLKAERTGTRVTVRIAAR